MEMLYLLERAEGGGEENGGGFVDARGMPKRWQDEPGSPAWQRSLEISARMRRN